MVRNADDREDCWRFHDGGDAGGTKKGSENAVHAASLIRITSYLNAIHCSVNMAIASNIGRAAR